MPIFRRGSILGIFGAFWGHLGPENGSKINFGPNKKPLEIPLTILKTKELTKAGDPGAWNDCGTPTTRQRRHNTLLRGVKRGFNFKYKEIS